MAKHHFVRGENAINAFRGSGGSNGPIDARGYRSNVGLALIMFLVGIKVGLRLST